MKRANFIIYLIAVLILSSNYCTGQKIKCQNDTVKVDGHAYAILKKKSAGPMRSDYIVNGLAGTELIYFRSVLGPYTGGFKYGQGEELTYEATFIASGSKADLKYYTENGIAKLIVENNLVKDNMIDAESEARFIHLNNGYLVTNTVNDPPEKTPLVVVNINNNGGNTSDNNSVTQTPQATKSNSPVILDGNKIMRDDKIIGKFRMDTTTSVYSQRMIFIMVYSESGEKVAEASVPLTNRQEWTIKIISENKSYNIMYDPPNELENLFRWLADKNYLSK
jgi:hypothetical protein